MGEGETEARELIAAASLLWWWWCPPQVFAVVTAKDRPNGIGRQMSTVRNTFNAGNECSFSVQHPLVPSPLRIL